MADDNLTLKYSISVKGMSVEEADEHILLLLHKLKEEGEITDYDGYL